MGYLEEHGPEFYARVELRSRLQSLIDLFTNKLHVVHQVSLREAPIEAYNSMAAFIGTVPFPNSTVFKRYNSWRGHRTELCRNSTLRSAMKDHLNSDYLALEELLEAYGQLVPLELRLRLSRC